MPSRPLIILPLNSFAHGGVERVALRLARHWLAAGAPVQVIVADGDGPLAGEAPPTTEVLGCGAAEPQRSLALAAAVAAAVRDARARGQEVRLFAAGNTYALVAALVRLRMGSAAPPIIIKISNDLARPDMPWPVRRAYRLWLRVQGRMFDRFIGLAAPMAAEIAGAMAVPPDKVAIIEDPALSRADLEALTALGERRQLVSTGRRYVAVGRMVRQKNFARGLRAFAVVARPSDHLTIIGDGPERPALQALATELGIAGQVSLPGAGPPAPALAAADVFLLSSDYEALPAAVVEALASGLPVVATDCCVSMRALVGDFGTVVPAGDTAALAAALAAQPALTPGQRRAAASAMAAFTVERAAGCYLDALAAAGRKNAILGCDAPAVLTSVAAPTAPTVMEPQC